MNWSNVGKKLAQVFTTAAQDLNPVLVVEGPKRYPYATVFYMALMYLYTVTDNTA